MKKKELKKQFKKVLKGAKKGDSTASALLSAIAQYKSRGSGAGVVINANNLRDNDNMLKTGDVINWNE